MRALLLPVKDLHNAKKRLTGVLTPEERFALAEVMLADTIRAVRGVRRADKIFVITNYEPAIHLAEENGWEILLEEQQIALLENGVRIIALRELGDRDAADDVVQETLARTLKALASEQLRDPLRLGAFVRGIAHNVIADVIRKKTKRGTEPEPSWKLEVPSADA